MPGKVQVQTTGHKLDPSLYLPLPEETAFLKSQVRIEDEEELKSHIFAVQKEAWEVMNYMCIRSFGFLTLKISHLPQYEAFLALGRSRPRAIFLDFACCFGNDSRKVVADGYPIENVIASDIQKEFWDLGHKLYRSTPETFPVPFLPGDIFDPTHIAPTPPYYSPPTTQIPADLSTLNSLIPLQGHVSAIHVSAFFHLFKKEKQIYAARALASLLSPIPGSMIFGTQSTLEVSGERRMRVWNDNMWCFNVEDWKSLWKDIFKEGNIEVEASLVERGKDAWRGRWETADSESETLSQRRTIVWCVRRV